MQDPLWVSMMVWGTWLLVAIIIDGVLLPIKLVLARRSLKNLNNHSVGEDDLPEITIVIPSHNEEDTIHECILSIINSSYPSERMQVIVVDDGSKDATRNEIKRVMVDAIMAGVRFEFIEKIHTGKVHTLNTGLRKAEGEIIFTVDADVILERNALKNMVKVFLADEKVGAASGYIEVRWNPLRTRFREKFFSRCEFLEYLNSFNFERNYQSWIDSLYTMSGAFSAFRRRVMGSIGGYWPVTVAEDMHVTMMLHRKKIDVVNVPDAIGYVSAITDYDTLYSQRSRWARGQLEVAAISCKNDYDEDRTSLMDILSMIRDTGNPKLIGLIFSYISTLLKDSVEDLKGKSWRYFDLMGLLRILFVDHTIAFPRLLWLFVLILLPLMGLYIQVIPIVMVLMYVFYLLMDLIVTIFAYNYSSNETRLKIEEAIPFIILMPVYRIIIFCFRVSAFLQALNEPANWRVQGPINGIKNGASDMKDNLARNIEAMIVGLSGSYFSKRKGK
ncbi:glycosyltransferase [Methanothermobacter sp.]|uniref:glycosyltransferase n=1 Tax=Methanothermobacter sp. TaxID=1884223 RepID=UPI002612FD3A|nr:glycosyltransferase [Methanothermobacter sp.]MDI9615636.1 glycosyltransferase [Methanothermobacter sp.]